MDDGRSVVVQLRQEGASTLMPSKRIAMPHLGRRALCVGYPSTPCQALAQGVDVVPLAAMLPPGSPGARATATMSP